MQLTTDYYLPLSPAYHFILLTAIAVVQTEKSWFPSPDKSAVFLPAGDTDLHRLAVQVSETLC